MLQQHDWNETPDADVVPYDVYQLTVSSFAKEYSGNGKVMLRLEATIDAPPAFKGTVVNNLFVLGTDEDPEADLPETWKRRAAKDLKKLLIAVYGDVAQLSGDPEADSLGTVGYPFGAILDVEIEPEQKKNRDTGLMEDNEFAGFERQRFRKYFNVADMPAAGSLAGTASPQAARAATRATTPPPRGAARPAAQRPPSQPPARPAPTAVSVPAEVGDEGNGVAVPTPAARPAPRPAPTPAAAGARPAPPARPAPRPVPRA